MNLWAWWWWKAETITACNDKNSKILQILRDIECDRGEWWNDNTAERLKQIAMKDNVDFAHILFKWKLLFVGLYVFVFVTLKSYFYCTMTANSLWNNEKIKLSLVILTSVLVEHWRNIAEITTCSSIMMERKSNIWHHWFAWT